jgi:hypothetical protein
MSKEKASAIIQRLRNLINVRDPYLTIAGGLELECSHTRKGYHNSQGNGNNAL